MKLTPEQSGLLKRIDEILWEDWDPIGVNDIEDARDEYSSYAGMIFSATIQNSSIEEIAEKLKRIETHQMGIHRDKSYSLKVAEKIKIEYENSLKTTNQTAFKSTNRGTQ